MAANRCLRACQSRVAYHILLLMHVFLLYRTILNVEASELGPEHMYVFLMGLELVILQLQLLPLMKHFLWVSVAEGILTPGTLRTCAMAMEAIGSAPYYESSEGLKLFYD